jgi:hypothetical protein
MTAQPRREAGNITRTVEAARDGIPASAAAAAIGLDTGSCSARGLTIRVLHGRVHRVGRAHYYPSMLIKNC